MECRIHLRYQHHLRGVTESDMIERLNNNSQHHQALLCCSLSHTSLGKQLELRVLPQLVTSHIQVICFIITCHFSVGDSRAE